MSDGKRIGGRQRSLSFKSLNFLLPWETSARTVSQERLRDALFYVDLSGFLSLVS